jgi:glycolate oxidase FAD binding subunit
VIAAQLKSAAGDDVLVDLDLRQFEKYGVEAAAAVAPTTAEGAAAVLGLCAREKWPVVPCGNGTRPAAVRAALDRAGATRPVLLSSARLADVREYEPSDLVIGVGAGMTHARLADVLAGKGQDLPLDPPMLPESTIGGTIALNAAGPLRAGHGLPRDAVLGVEVATGDGRLLRFGGRVVKNVAGYDGVRLLTGSAGSLGLITSVYLRLRGRPRQDVTLLYERDSAADAAALALAVRSAVACDALDVLSPGLSRDIGLSMKWSVLARIRGGDAAVQESEGRIAAAAGGRGAPVHDVWPALSRLEAMAEIAYAAVCQPASLPELIAVMAAADGHLAAHGADGVVRGWGAQPAAAIRETVLQRGWVWREAGQRSTRRGVDQRAVQLERQLQATFDPAGILLPRLAVLA